MFLVVIAGTAAAGTSDPEWPSSSASIGFTDDRDFNYTSTESNEADFWDFVEYVDYAMFDVWGALTDLSARSKHRTFYSWIDIGWYMTDFGQGSNVGGDTVCRAWRDRAAKICDRNRVRFSEDYLRRTPGSFATQQKRNVACHEAGHAVGFGHGDTARSCMDGGGNARISWYERSLVNARY